MTGKHLKRLDLLLPEEHPIFKCPKGKRSRVAREWLDIGARLSEIEKAISEIREMLDGRQSAERKVKGGAQAGIDAAAFAKKIGGLFG
jgi:hypothetical protein